MIHVDPIDHYSGAVPTGRRRLGIFPLARVALPRPLACPGGSQWIHKADPKGSKAKPWRASLARSGARFVPEDGLTAACNWLATPELGVAEGSAAARTYQAAAAPGFGPRRNVAAGVAPATTSARGGGFPSPPDVDWG